MAYLPLVHEVGKKQDGLIDKKYIFFQKGMRQKLRPFLVHEGGEAWANSEYIEQKIIQ